LDARSDPAEAHPDWPAAVQLRRWDDAAKDPAADVPGLDAYGDTVVDVIRRHRESQP